LRFLFHRWNMLGTGAHLLTGADVRLERHPVMTSLRSCRMWLVCVAGLSLALVLAACDSDTKSESAKVAVRPNSPTPSDVPRANRGQTPSPNPCDRKAVPNTGVGGELVIYTSERHPACVSFTGQVQAALGAQYANGGKAGPFDNGAVICYILVFDGDISTNDYGYIRRGITLEVDGRPHDPDTVIATDLANKQWGRQVTCYNASPRGKQYLLKPKEGRGSGSIAVPAPPKNLPELLPAKIPAR
jgi:hypothetical protein